MRRTEAETGGGHQRGDAFEFGRNWQRYVEDHLDAERVKIAARSLRDLVGEPLSGKLFLDVGAGSGVFSLSAHLGGAAKVISLDVDADSVEACRTLRRSIGDPENWEIVEGSILDPALLSELPRADIVYSWGVLHHTGEMYPAIRNAAELVVPGGLLCIAIYNDAVRRVFDSRRWKTIKRCYNRSPLLIQRAMELTYLGVWALRQLNRRKNPLAAAVEYKQARGMALQTDVADWLGGYPYEYASADQIVDFCREQCRLDVVRVVRTESRSTGNNEFVFRRPVAVKGA
jgi:2-polyprenyl-6-hydroxyphenyl methylase/3-demethylubiquinone-9 3-methyltransferase